MELLQWSLFGNTLRTWVIALLAAAVVLTSLRLIKRAVLRHVSGLTGKTDSALDDLAIAVIGATRPFFLAILALFTATRFLYLPAEPAAASGAIMVIALLVQAGLWGNVAITFLLNRTIDRQPGQDPGAATTLRFLGFIGRFVLWTMIVLLVLRNALDQDISALIAGLGVGGIAVALAVQNILGDLFASLSIILDKPFVIGDFVIVDEHMGTVEHVGLKTTRIRSLSGEQIIFANNDMLKSRIRNYKRMFERRVVFSFRVAHGTPTEKLAAIPGTVRELVEAHEKTRFDRAHFHRFGDFALDFEVVYNVLDPDYNAYMDIQQAINLELIRHFEAEGIAFAFPTQTIRLEGAGTVVAGGGG